MASAALPSSGNGLGGAADECILDQIRGGLRSGYPVAIGAQARYQASVLGKFTPREEAQFSARSVACSRGRVKVLPDTSKLVPTVR